jgi:hypothetical protein
MANDSNQHVLRYGLVGVGALMMSVGGSNCVAGYWSPGAWHAGYGSGFVPVFYALLLLGVVALIVADRLGEGEDHIARFALIVPVLLAWPLRGAIVQTVWSMECGMGRSGGCFGQAVALDYTDQLPEAALPIYLQVCEAEPDPSRNPEVALSTLERACIRAAEIDDGAGCPPLKALCEGGGRTEPCRAAARICG